MMLYIVWATTPITDIRDQQRIRQNTHQAIATCPNHFEHIATGKRNSVLTHTADQVQHITCPSSCKREILATIAEVCLNFRLLQEEGHVMCCTWSAVCVNTLFLFDEITLLVYQDQEAVNIQLSHPCRMEKAMLVIVRPTWLSPSYMDAKAVCLQPLDPDRREA
jgi:hypothetical protein